LSVRAVARDAPIGYLSGAPVELSGGIRRGFLSAQMAMGSPTCGLEL
jgi:hypothetical protein